MAKKYLEPISLGKLNALYDEVSALPAYTRIMRRVRRGVARTDYIEDRSQIDEQQRAKVQTQIETIEDWLAAAKATLL